MDQISNVDFIKIMIIFKSLLKISGSKIIFLLAWLTVSACTSYKKESPSINTFRTYSLAVEQYQAKNFEEALKYVNEALSSNNKIAQYYELKGDILSGMTEYSRALIAYEKSRELRFTPSIIVKTGNTNFKLKKYNEAVHNYKLAYAQNPQQTELLLLLLDCYIQQNELELAVNQLAEYKKTLEKRNLQADPYYYIIVAKIQFERANYTEAAEAVDKAGGAKNRNEAVFYLRTLFYINNQEKAYKLATKEYNKILSQADIHFFRGLYYYKQGNYNVAKTQLELSVQQRAQIAEAYKLLSDIYFGENNASKAAETIENSKKFSVERIINIGLEI